MAKNLFLAEQCVDGSSRRRGRCQALPVSPRSGGLRHPSAHRRGGADCRAADALRHPSAHPSGRAAARLGGAGGRRRRRSRAAARGGLAPVARRAPAPRRPRQPLVGPRTPPRGAIRRRPARRAVGVRGVAGVDLPPRGARHARAGRHGALLRSPGVRGGRLGARAGAQGSGGKTPFDEKPLPTRDPFQCGTPSDAAPAAFVPQSALVGCDC